MKSFILCLLALSLSFSVLCRNPFRTDRYGQRIPAVFKPEVIPVQPSKTYAPGNPTNEDNLGYTRYDLQTNGSVQNRLVLFPDGTMGAVWTYSADNQGVYADRGTGYNYFNSTAWQTQPGARVETVRTGWPSYCSWNGNGEMIMAHNSSPTLVMSTRPQRGSGMWTEHLKPAAPGGAPGLAWCRAITSGAGSLNIHVLALTLPLSSGGAPWNGLDGALLYWRSTDGGATWNINGVQLPSLTSANYDAFSADQYAWGSPHADTIYFCVGGPYTDTFIMKSDDNGTTWSKIPILSNAHKKIPVSVNYLPPWRSSDGSMACELGSGGIVHFVSGIGGGSMEGGERYIRPYLNGLLYWNSTMEMLPDSLDLDTLYNRGQLIGWYEDGPDPGDTLQNLSSYRGGLCSHPQLSIRENGDQFVVYDQVTYANPEPLTNVNYRHIFSNSRFAGTPNWTSDHGLDQMTNSTYNFLEFSFPSMIKNVPEEVSPYPWETPPGYTCRVSPYPGLSYGSVQPGLSQIWYFGDIYVGTDEALKKADFIGQNYPNPASGTTSFDVHLTETTPFRVEVTDLAGQLLWCRTWGLLPSGIHRIDLDVSSLLSGIYIYTATTGDLRISKKLMVE